MRTTSITLAAVLIALAAISARAGRSTLDIYVLDVEGGNATLMVSPEGRSLLIDTGNGGAAAERDAARILAAVRDAGLSRLDTVLTTHYHGDHVGALDALASRLPVGRLLDHGANVQADPLIDGFLQGRYRELQRQAGHAVVTPGDAVPLGQVEVRVVTAAGRTIARPVAGTAVPNPLCAGHVPQQVNPVSGQPTGATEDEQSVGTLVRFGRFRALYLADLTWNKEFELMCPANRLGTVDLWVVSRHGQPSSNSPLLVHALRPRVAVMNNGLRKGGQPAAMRVLRTSPGLEDLWQMHASVLSGQEYTVPGAFIANLPDVVPSTMPTDPVVVPPGQPLPPAPAHEGPAFWIKVSAEASGRFFVTNSRNGFTRTYDARTR